MLAVGPCSTSAYSTAAVGHVRNHAHVVRDDDRALPARGTASSAVPGSAPGWERSSAVVGSSAMMTSGSQHAPAQSPRALHAARNWWGYCFAQFRHSRLHQQLHRARLGLGVCQVQVDHGQRLSTVCSGSRSADLGRSCRRGARAPYALRGRPACVVRRSAAPSRRQAPGRFQP